MANYDSVRIASCSILLAIAGHAADSRAQAEEDAPGSSDVPVSNVEVTADGLHRVDPALMENTWLLPDADLSLYTRAFVMPAVILFRDLPEISKNAWADRDRSVFPVGEIMQERLRETFGQSFHEAMARQRDFDLTEELGRDVLLVRAYMTEVATGVPPQLAGNNVITVRWVWEAYLTVELRDSMSDQILARIRARERVDGPVEAARVYSMAPQIMRRWSNLMIEQLDELTDFYPSRLYRLHERASQQSGQDTTPPVD